MKKLIMSVLLVSVIAGSCFAGGGFYGNKSRVRPVVVSNPINDNAPKIIEKTTVEKPIYKTIAPEPIVPQRGFGIGFDDGYPVLTYDDSVFGIEVGGKIIADDKSMLVKLFGKSDVLSWLLGKENIVRAGLYAYPYLDTGNSYGLLLGAERHLSNTTAVFADCGFGQKDGVQQIGAVSFGGRVNF